MECQKKEVSCTTFNFSIFTFRFHLYFFFKFLFTSPFGPSWLRKLISDFAVIMAIIIMVGVDLGVGLKDTPKLFVPSTFVPTRSDRGWWISPIDKNEPWTIGLAIAFALLATILIFMDQQITTVIVNRKENKLTKGCGYVLLLIDFFNDFIN